jgi:CO/xanthine dehydrogenase FAD-binding subunit
MILPRFEYLEPQTIQEAISNLQKYPGQAEILAGGTDLIVNIKKRKIKPEIIVSISKIPEFNRISYSDDNGLELGSMVNVSELVESPVIKTVFPVLSKAASKLGSKQIRNRATVGGNICSARPAGDIIGPLIACGAKVQIVSPTGEREEKLEAIFTGPGLTTIGKDEILTKIIIDNQQRNYVSNYLKHGIRNAMEIALVSVTVILNIDNNICRSARIVLGAVAPTFIHSLEAEQYLEGKKISEDVAKRAGQLAASSCKPISDIRASADYRRHLVRVLTKRSLLEAVLCLSNN